MSFIHVAARSERDFMGIVKGGSSRKALFLITAARLGSGSGSGSVFGGFLVFGLG